MENSWFRFFNVTNRLFATIIFWYHVGILLNGRWHSIHYQSVSKIPGVRESCWSRKYSLGTNSNFKVHKILRNLHRRFDRSYIWQIYGGDFANIFGLLRIYELYLPFRLLLKKQACKERQIFTHKKTKIIERYCEKQPGVITSLI